MLTTEEKAILQALDAAVSCESTATRIDEIVSCVEQELSRKPDDLLAWNPVPLSLYHLPLPDMIRSSWVFILRANTVTGAERHPNSHQRMMSYRGAGDFQTRTGGPWCSHRLTSDPAAPLEERWISIPPNVWHQGVVAETNWIVVSFHTVLDHELIEERPDPESSNAFRRRKYVGEREKSA
jgi:hypothetical protein